MAISKNSFNTRNQFSVAGKSYSFYQLDRLEAAGFKNISLLPFSIRVLLESVLRNENGKEITADDVRKLAEYDPESPGDAEIPFMPARVILQDFTGVPSVVDLAALRSAMHRFGGDPEKINPVVPVDLVIDHSVQVDQFGTPDAVTRNSEIEFIRNRERYEFLRWGQKAFKNFNVIPPSSGIIHQVNLEYIAKVVRVDDLDGMRIAFPDTLVGTDSHTTMINGTGVLGWGVGGIEAEAVMLGQPIFMRMPEVIGVKFVGKLPEGATATDLTLRVTQVLREVDVVGKFVEYFGPGVSELKLADRATVANMAPEYGATMGFFPIDQETLDYLRQTGRSAEHVQLIEQYCRLQGLFRTSETPEPEYKKVVTIDLSTITPAVAGPKRPQDRIDIAGFKSAWKKSLEAPVKQRGFALSEEKIRTRVSLELDGVQTELTHGSVVIAAITSCTNTSNPSVILGAGLMAKKAVEKGLSVPAYVKTSLAPGSRVVTEYLKSTGLLPFLEKLRFHVVGYGCTTCIGNSGPLPAPVSKAIEEGQLVVAGVLSGNRNFEGRINPFIQANYLASPPLVIAYALAGTVDIDLTSDPLGTDSDGNPVFLKDIQPTNEELEKLYHQAMQPEKYTGVYQGIEKSNPTWNAIPVADEPVYSWVDTSTYIQEPPFFTSLTREVKPIKPIQNARVLVMVGDSVTTDHISPAGAIPEDGPAGKYLISMGIQPSEFNSFGSRRGNDRVMTRGTFANIRLKNKLGQGREGGWTTYHETGELMSIFDAGEKYKAKDIPTIVLAGKDYGMGSSRDWAAKGTYLLGIRAVIAESFERIHRSNLIGMGVLPLQFKQGESSEALGLTGTEVFSVNIDDSLTPGQVVRIDYQTRDGENHSFEAICRLDTPVEIDYYRNGGILHSKLREMLKDNS